MAVYTLLQINFVAIQQSNTISWESSFVLYSVLVPGSHQSQYQDHETEGTTLNSSITDCKMYTCAFPAVTCKNVICKKGLFPSHRLKVLVWFVSGSSSGLKSIPAGTDYICTEHKHVWLDCSGESRYESWHTRAPAKLRSVIKGNDSMCCGLCLNTSACGGPQPTPRLTVVILGTTPRPS